MKRIDMSDLGLRNLIIHSACQSKISKGSCSILWINLLFLCKILDNEKEKPNPSS